MNTQPAAAPDPQNLEAEERVLGAMMLAGSACDRVLELNLDPTDFYRASHGRIYHAAAAIHTTGGAVDAVTVAARLRELGTLDQTGGIERIRELATLVLTASNVQHHARIVQRAARLRRAAASAERIRQQATAGAPAETVEAALDDLARQLLEERNADTSRHRVTPAAEFLESFEETAVALIGEPGETLLPAGGLLILGGEAGSSKTTLTLDAVAHLAAGVPWLGYPIPRPARILIIENEGPRTQFRAKLAAKAASWEGPPFLQNLHILEEPWAAFTFQNPTDRRALRQHAANHQIDVVIGDPLDSLGIAGGGTPDDTRMFMGWLRECGLHNPLNPLAFMILHHFNKQAGGTIVSRLSGAWGNHADTVLGTELAEGHATKLTWAKLRHATPPAKQTAILTWNLDTRGFTLTTQTEEQAARRTARQQEAVEATAAYVTDHPGQSKEQIRTALAEQLSIRRDTVSAALTQLAAAGTLEHRPAPRRSTIWYAAGEAPQADLNDPTPKAPGEDGVKSGDLTHASRSMTSPGEEKGGVLSITPPLHGVKSRDAHQTTPPREPQTAKPTETTTTHETPSRADGMLGFPHRRESLSDKNGRESVSDDLTSRELLDLQREQDARRLHQESIEDGFGEPVEAQE